MSDPVFDNPGRHVTVSASERWSGDPQLITGGTLGVEHESGYCYEFNSRSAHTMTEPVIQDHPADLSETAASASDLPALGGTFSESPLHLEEKVAILLSF